jgi:hypothetical protein
MMSSETKSAEVLTPLEVDWHNLRWGVRRSIRYHMRRERFLRTCHRWVSFINVLSGSATVSLLLANKSFEVVAQATALVVVFVSTLDLVINFSAQADTHHTLRRRFCELEQAMECAPGSEALTKCRQKRSAIEADEPPIYRALDRLAYNELLIADGYRKGEPDVSIKHVPSHQRWLANVFRFESNPTALPDS